MQIIGETRVIASLYPMPTERLTRDYVPLGKKGGCSHFQMLPHEGGKHPPVLLHVPDCWQVYRSPDDPFEQQTKNIDVRQVTKDLCSDHWRKPLLGAPNDCGPAIWIVNGRAATKEEIETSANLDIVDGMPWTFVPTPEECAAELDRQKRYWIWLYQKAQELAFNQKYADINNLHRLAARQLGRPDDWAATQMESTSCMWCTKMISAAAYVCPECNRPVKEPTAEMRKMMQGFQYDPSGAPGLPQIAVPPVKQTPQPHVNR